MDSSLKQIFDCFFQRAVISVSYSAANRLSQYVMMDQDSPTFTILVLSISFSIPFFVKNECLQTTLAILLSKIVIRCLLVNIEAQSSYLILPTLCFYLVFCSKLCDAVLQSSPSPTFKTQWNSIVPFIVNSCTSEIIKLFQIQRQIHFLYFSVLFYPFCSQSLQSYPFLSLFIDSIISRGIVLIVENYVFGKIHKADLALSFFYMCILVCAHFLLQSYKPNKSITTTNDKNDNDDDDATNKSKGPISKQVDICLGVLLYSFSNHLLQTMQTYCNNQLITTFALTGALLVLLLYHKSYNMASIDFCINSLSILWSSIFDTWLFNFYHNYEPLFIYLLVFVLIQYMHDHIAGVLNISAFNSYDESNNREIMLIATENVASPNNDGMQNADSSASDTRRHHSHHHFPSSRHP